MRATGIVRRLDDLGRIVIPKEIRRSLNINENDAMEIWVTDDHAGIMLLKQAAEMMEGTNQNAAYRDLILHIANRLAE